MDRRRNVYWDLGPRLNQFQPGVAFLTSNRRNVSTWSNKSLNEGSNAIGSCHADSGIVVRSCHNVRSILCTIPHEIFHRNNLSG